METQIDPKQIDPSEFPKKEAVFDPKKFGKSGSSGSFIARQRPGIYAWFSSIALALAGVLETYIQGGQYMWLNGIYLNATQGAITLGQMPTAPSPIWFIGSVVFLLVGLGSLAWNLWRQFRK